MDEKRERDGGNTTRSWWMKRERWREYYQGLVDEKRERWREYYRELVDEKRERWREYYQELVDEKRERWREYYQELVDEKRERDGGNTTRSWWMKREREMEGILPGAGG